jgi:hypothetical protein
MVIEQRFRLELLNGQHSIEQFRCENEEINTYLHEDALADMAKDVARTFVEIDGKEPATNNVAGFFTLRADALNIREDYFEDWADGSEDIKAWPSPINVPLVELMLLARDLQWKGQGMGDTLMIDVVKTVAAAADCIALIGLHLRSTDKGVRLYTEYEFQPFKEHPTYDEYRYILPIGTIRVIASRAIK